MVSKVWEILIWWHLWPSDLTADWRFRFSTVLEALKDGSDLDFAVNGQLIWRNVVLKQDSSLKSIGLDNDSGQNLNFFHQNLNLEIQSASTNESQGPRSTKVKLRSVLL